MLSEQLLRAIIDERDREIQARIRVHGLPGGRRHPSRPHPPTPSHPSSDPTTGGRVR